MRPAKPAGIYDMENKKEGTALRHVSPSFFVHASDADASRSGSGEGKLLVIIVRERNTIRDILEPRHVSDRFVLLGRGHRIGGRLRRSASSGRSSCCCGVVEVKPLPGLACFSGRCHYESHILRKDVCRIDLDAILVRV